VGFVSLAEALDLTTSTGRAMAGMLAVFAEFERGSCQFCAHGGACRASLKSASALRVSGDGNAGGASLWRTRIRRLAPCAPTVGVEPLPRLPR
jgi:hypothetical protein